MKSTAKKRLGCFMLIGICLLAVGCTTNVSRFQMPDTDLSKVRALYIRPLDDEREAVELRSLIETNLSRRGFQLAVNDQSLDSSEGDFIFDIAADWHWDLAWYLLELRVAIYDPNDSTLIAQAQSQQTSFARQSIEVIVERAMASLFDDNQEPSGEE
ncbi:MAG: hypothetical protein WBM76_17510 [Woeseiaceae bacterium]